MIRRKSVRLAAAAGVSLVMGITVRPATAATGTVTVSSQQVGTTLQHVGYNMGHYLPGSNTSAWVEYSGVNAFRVWAASSYYEPRAGGTRDDDTVWGDGVNNLTAFNNRKAALRANPLSQTYINWTGAGTGSKRGFNHYFENFEQSGSNSVKLNYILGELNDRGIHVLQQTTRTPAAGPINGESDWAGKWEQWQHYYAMAFHSARHYGVAQWQMYNEPDGDDSTSQADWVMRLKLASDAVRSAVSDVNRIYGKNLVADIAAPVSAGGSVKVDGGGNPDRAWGQAALQNIRTDYQGQTVNYDIFNTYSAQVYEQSGAGFGNEVDGIKSKIPLYHAGGATAGQQMPVIFSEFNRHGSNNLANANFANVSMETPYVFTDIASTYVHAMAQGTTAMYAFKFSQTEWTPRRDSGEPVQQPQPQKTGFHYVSEVGNKDITGATHASGVVRLVAKAFTDERARLNATTSSPIGTYDLATSYDPVSSNYYLFGVNRSDGESHTLTFDLSGWDVQPGTIVSVEEVSSGHNGEVTHLVPVPANKKIQLTQPTRSVWLLTAPSGPAQSVLTLNPTADARVRNDENGTGAGNYSVQNFGTLDRARVGRTAVSALNDSATYVKFDVSDADAADVSRAIFRVTGRAMTDDGSPVAAPVLFHVYALASDAWTESGVTWDNAPNLLDFTRTTDGRPDAKADGVGTTAWPVGQLTFAAGAPQLVGIDLTQFLSLHPEVFDDGTLSLALIREERFAGDGDASAFVELFTKESGGATAPQLLLFGVVPEPGSLALIGMTGMGLLSRRRR